MTMHNIQSPSADDGVMEQRLQTLGKTAPRVKPSDVEQAIVAAYYFTALQGAEKAAMDSGGWPVAGSPVAVVASGPELSLLTFCVLILKNGFAVTGESVCASPENFDAEFGRSVAYTAAKNKVWQLLGYALKDRLHADAQIGQENA